MTHDDDKAPGASFAETQEAIGDPSQPDVFAVTRVAKLEQQMTSLRNDYLRALADAQNANARADRRIEQSTKYAIANFVKDLVTVADNLNRALQHVPLEARTSNELLNSLATGVEMTEKSLLTLMERNGLHRLDSLNQPFDPHQHQAVQEIEDKSIPAGTVVQVLQEGYILHDRLVRPAMVVISRGGPKRQPPPESQTLDDWLATAAGGHINTSV